MKLTLSQRERREATRLKIYYKNRKLYIQAICKEQESF